MDKKQVEKIAVLARLRLTQQEKEKYTGQLERILDYVDQLQELDTENITPFTQPLIDALPLAEDKHKEFKDSDALINNAPDSKDRFFRVKKVIE